MQRTRDGYDFLGWFIGEDEWQFNSYRLVGNVTITAKWEHSDLLGIYQDRSQLEERWYGGMEKWYDAPEN